MRGAKFPQAIRSIPLLKAGSRTLAYVDWITPERKGDLEEVIGKIDTPALRTAFADVTAAWSALEVLSRALDERLGNDAAPNFLSPENTSSIGTAIEQCLQLIREIAHRRGVELEPSANGAAEPEAGDASLAPSSPTAASTAPGNSREELYRQIEVIATTLKRIEPHSPIPFMLERCVRLGGLPVPSLMRAIIRETGTLDELDRIMRHRSAGGGLNPGEIDFLKIAKKETRSGASFLRGYPSSFSLKIDGFGRGLVAVVTILLRLRESSTRG